MADAGNISVGYTLAISVGAPSTYDAAGFAAKSYTVVAEIESIPDFGGTAQVPEFIPLATGVVDKAKGSINYGDFTAPLRREITDAGQVALQAGFDGVNRNTIHSVRLSHPTGGTLYFTAYVSSFTYNIADANAWTRNGVTFAINARPVPVADVFLVQFVAGTNGSIIGATQQYVLTGGNCTAVYAAPAAGYEFTAWNDANTDNPRIVTNVTAAATYTATFALE
jgi:hypothetical protein